MKYNRFLRILAIAAVLSLLMIVIPATPSLAAAELMVSPVKAEIGDYVNVAGEDFTPAVDVTIYFSSDEAEVGDEIDVEVTSYEIVQDPAIVSGPGDLPPGVFDYDIDIPSELTDGDDDEDVHGGDYYFYATKRGDDEIKAVAPFNVIGIKKLNPAEGPVNTEVEIEGVGYDEYEDITVNYDGVEVDIVDGDDETDSGGAFKDTIIIVPESTAGAHTITVVGDESGYEGNATFNVEPEMTLSATAGAIAANITINGTGFGENQDITVTFDDERVDIIGGDDNTNANGSFEAVFAVPELEPGTYPVVVEDDDDNTAQIGFTITTNLTINPLYTAASPGWVGAQVTISGVGFKANSPITITYASEPVVFSAESLADGSFSYLLTIPPSEAGPHTITVTDGVIPTPQQVTFYMESTPPATPQPKQPVDEKLGGGKFKWDTVTDLSAPVTYDLQIATDANFTDILVEKAGLTASEYPLTDDEELGSTSDEESYYWRVRAVDAASNTSNWSGATAFQVGFSFELKGWLLYTVIGVGAVIVFFLGFWVGRRTGYDYY